MDQKKERPVITLTDASSSQEVRRQVKIVEKEHPNPSNSLKRQASG